MHKDSILSIALIDTALQRMSNIVPYLVVGGGPTGLTAALEMARRGLPVHIIDDDFDPSPESRALAIHAPTLDMLEASGVTERLLAAGHKIRNIVVHEKGRIILALPLSDIPHRYNFILALPQSHTEQILTDALAETGVQLGYGTRLESFSCTGNGATATLVANAQRQQVAAAAVIGADGAHSIVRKQAGISFDGESEPQQFGLADITLDAWPWPFDTAVAELLDDGVVGFIPMAEGFGRLISNREHALDAITAWRQHQPGRLDLEFSRQLPAGGNLSARLRIPRRRRSPHSLSSRWHGHEPRHGRCCHVGAVAG